MLASLLSLGLLVLAGCSTPKQPAPVEDRGTRGAARPAPPPAETPRADAAATDTRPPGTYVVKPGDTLMRIALENGQAWRDLVRWNNIENPNLIEVGQVLVVQPPADAAAVASRPVTLPKLEPKPLDAKGAASAASGAAPAPVPSPATSAAASSPLPPMPAPVAAPARESDDDVQWAWPATGPVATPFDDNRSKGLAITGKAGDPVYAAADGRVVYAGSGLRGYGNLVIVKHNATYLTAYAHNQTLLVKEDQTVKKGQKIAEMGASDADRVQLHFEIRRQGKPIDPAKLLPAR